MERNRFIPDFGVLNKFFDDYITPEEFLNDLTDIITEYSALALIAEDKADQRGAAFRINVLNALHREIRKGLK